MKQIQVRENGTKRVVTITNEQSLTDQSQKKACDINEIVRRYKKTGQLTHTTERQPLYQDVSKIPDLIGALEQVTKAQEAFMSIPSQLRKRLNNDPANLIEYLNDSKNDEEAIKLGIKVKKELAGETPAASNPVGGASVPATGGASDPKK